MEGLPARFVGWLVSKIGRQALFALALLLAWLASLVITLAEIVRGLDSGLLWSVGTLAVAAGWLLARSRWPTWAGLLAGAGLGVVLAAGRVGRLVTPIFMLLSQAASWAGTAARWLAGWLAAWIHWQPRPAPPPVEVLRPAAEGLLNAIATLLHRTTSWASGLLSGLPVFDPVAAALVWALAVWLVMAWAAWGVRRLNRPLAAALPGGVLLAASLAAVRRPPYILLLFLAATFVLMAWYSYSQRERNWSAAGVDFSEDIHLDLAGGAGVIVIVVLFVAGLSPAFSPEKIKELWQKLVPPPPVVQQPVARSFGLEPPRATARPSLLVARQGGGLPREHLLGTGPELSKRVVMLIQTGDFPAGPLPLGQAAPNYYWRALNYDQYTGRGWYANEGNPFLYPAGARLLGEEQGEIQAPSPAFRIVTADIQPPTDASGRPAAPQTQLAYAAGELLSLDRSFEAGWRIKPDAPSGPGAFLAGQADLFGASLTATSYRAISLWPAPTEEQLRRAGSAFPDWIRLRYLSLPEEVPGRVLALGRDLTATQPNDYDRALAIESYLRAYPYTLDLPPAPISRDVVDYFLFDLKRGYCDYYASAFVVLARAAGLPARLAMGYATGQYQAETGQYVVTEADAHSWPEVFFPGYGWIRFEPTAARPALDRDLNASQPQAPAPAPASTSPGLPVLNWLRLLGLAAAALGGLLLIALAGLLSESFWLGLLTPERTLRHLYRRLYRQAGELAVPLAGRPTPYELAGALSGQLSALKAPARYQSRLAPAQGEVGQIADLYVQAIYSPRRPGKQEQKQALMTWNRLRYRLWAARALQAIRQIRTTRGF